MIPKSVDICFYATTYMARPTFLKVEKTVTVMRISRSYFDKSESCMDRYQHRKVVTYEIKTKMKFVFSTTTTVAPLFLS